MADKLNNRIDPAQIGTRMAEGAAWTVAMRLSIRMLGVISTIILARLLTPADYGLIALATVLAAAVELLGSFNFEVWLIRHPEPDSGHYDTVWTLSILRGLITAVLLIFLAEPLAGFYDDPRLSVVVRVIALGILLTSFTNAGVFEFQRNLRFDIDFVYNAVVKIGAFVVTVTLGFILRNYWALVAGIFSANILQLIASYIFHNYRPRISLLHGRDAFAFSKWLVTGNVLSFVRMRSDAFVLGKLSGNEVLGLYNVAKEIANLAASEILTPISRVLVPGYARLQDDRSELRRRFVEGFGVIMLVGIPCAVGIGVVADPLIRVMLGAKWLGAIPIMQALILNGVAVIALANQWPTLVALGRPGVGTLLLSICIVFFLPTLYLATDRYGVIGASFALGGANTLLALMGLVAIHRILGFSWRDLWANIWRTAIATLLMSIVALKLQSILSTGGFGSPVILLLCVALGAASYVLALYLQLLIARTEGGPERLLMEFVRKKISSRLRSRRQNR